MRETTAQDILVSLTQGLNPGSQAQLPADSVIHDPEVFRALLVGITALDRQDGRAMRRALLPPRVGTQWTTEEEAQLCKEFAAKTPMSAIAAAHGRLAKAIEMRLEKMGLITAKERVTPGNDFGY